MTADIKTFVSFVSGDENSKSRLIDLEIAKKCPLVEKQIQLFGTIEQEIPLLRINDKIMNMVIDWMENEDEFKKQMEKYRTKELYDIVDTELIDSFLQMENFQDKVGNYVAKTRLRAMTRREMQIELEYENPISEEEDEAICKELAEKSVDE